MRQKAGPVRTERPGFREEGGGRALRKELDHFRIGEACGGDQEWFSDPWMFRGGCGAVTACDLCICLARNMGMRELYPYDPEQITKEDYLSFAALMRPYLSPRPTGIHRTETYTDGLEAYLRDRGCRSLTLGSFSGQEDAESAVAVVREQIGRGFPVPYLMLLHRDRELKDYMWHWFLLGGYEESGKRFLVRVITYGEEKWMDLRHLWRTGYRQRGGIVRIFREGEMTKGSSEAGETEFLTGGGNHVV